MATMISEDEAYAHATDMLDRALRGEEIDIAREGAVRLKLMPIASGEGRR